MLVALILIVAAMITLPGCEAPSSGTDGRLLNLSHHHPDCDPLYRHGRPPAREAHVWSCQLHTPNQRSPCHGCYDTHFSTAPGFRRMNIQQVCPLRSAPALFRLALITKSPPHSLDRCHPISIGLSGSHVSQQSFDPSLLAQIESYSVGTPHSSPVSK